MNSEDKSKIVEYDLTVDLGEWKPQKKWKPELTREEAGQNYNTAWEYFERFGNPLDSDIGLDKIKPKWLGWYWKHLLPAVPEVSVGKYKDSIEIKISQIAESVLVTILHNNKLILPPIFCSISGLTRLDQEELYRYKFCKDISEEVAGINKIEDTNRRNRELQYVLGRHDLCYKIVNKHGLFGFEVDSKESSIVHVSMIPTLELHPFRFNESYKVEGNSVILDFPWETVELPISEKTVNSKRPHEKVDNDQSPMRILLSSKQMRKAYERISEVWNDPTVKSILLVAPPGSGKEILAQSIFRGKCLEGSFESMSVGGEPIERVVSILFGVSVPEWNEDGFAKDSPEIGLLAKAVNGAIFIDEIDKADEKVLAMLLRLLEQDTYMVSGSNMQVKLKKEFIPDNKTESVYVRPPLFIFAGSKSSKDMFAIEPLDFWTRISHVINIEHPLNLDDLNAKKNACKDYFVFFWMKHIPELFRRSEMINSKEQKIESMKLVNGYFSRLFNILIDDRVVATIAQIFVDYVDMDNGSLPSIRNIRSIVARVAYEIFDLLLYDKDPQNSWHELIVDSDQDVLDTLKEFFHYKDLKVEELSSKHAKFYELLSKRIVSCIHGVL